MRIVHVCNHYWPCVGGVERVVEDISSTLSERGHKVTVVCLNRCANSSERLRKHDSIGSVMIERMPFIDLKYYKVALGVLGKISDADVVHVHGIGFFSDFLVLTKFVHRKKVFVSTHGGFFHTKSIGFLKKIYFNFVQRVVLRFADKVIAVSKNDFELFKKIAKNVVLVENGVMVERFHAKKKKKNHFLFLGRFSKNKRIDLLLGAFGELHRKGLYFKLIIAGSDWEHLLGELVEETAELGLKEKVAFVVNPVQDETGHLYGSSEFFVSASQYEGFGLALVEAMASGCIPIVQENDGFSEILAQKQGFLVGFENPRKAAAEIEKAMNLITREKAALRKSATARANEFSWEARIKKLERIYGGKYEH